MKIVQESANEPSPSEKRRTEELQQANNEPGSLREEYLALCEQTPPGNETPLKQDDEVNQIREAKSAAQFDAKSIKTQSSKYRDV